MTDRGSIEFEHVGKRYGDVSAVRDVSFTIEHGTLVTLVGPSGCGKTTCLRLIAGLETPSDGRVRIGGRDVTGLSPGERDVSLVFQSYALFPHLDVLANVAYGPIVHGVSKAAAHAQAHDVIALIGLAGLESRLPSALSGGQQQRVALARALVLKPAVLLFDEPLSNLDAKLRRRVRDDIHALQRELGLTVVYVTHDREEALAVSDRIIVMDHGRIAESGAPRELFDTPTTAFVADFLGEANLIDATLTERGESLATLRVGPLSLKLPHRGVEAGACKVAVRPDAIVLSRAAGNGGLCAHVRRVAFVGRVSEYTLASEIGELFAVAPGAQDAFAQGERVTVHFASHGITVVR